MALERKRSHLHWAKADGQQQLCGIAAPAAHESFMRGQTYRRDSKERAPELTGGHAFNRCFALAPDVCVR
jgi:hypothetical protein